MNRPQQMTVTTKHFRMYTAFFLLFLYSQNLFFYLDFICLLSIEVVCCLV
jgi:hypothetical protein